MLKQKYVLDAQYMVNFIRRQIVTYKGVDVKSAVINYSVNTHAFLQIPS